MNEKGISKIPKESILNLVLFSDKSLNMLLSLLFLGINLIPTIISYLNGFLNLTDSECSSKTPLYTILGS